MGVTVRPAQGRKLKVLRWFVLCVVFWLASGGVFLVSSTLLMGEAITQAGVVDIDPTARFGFEAGDEFSVHATEGMVTCDVVPNAGESRSYRVTEARRKVRPKREVAWFTGDAELRCSGPARLVTPAYYARHDLAENLVLGCLMAGSACLVIAVGKIYLHSRRLRRVGGAR